MGKTTNNPYLLAVLVYNYAKVNWWSLFPRAHDIVGSLEDVLEIKIRWLHG